jgi:hypothetical protein
VAAGIELHARVHGCGVQRDDLVAHDVGAGGQAGWDGVGIGVARGHEGRVAPDGGGAGAAGFGDFEPDGTEGEGRVSVWSGTGMGWGRGCLRGAREIGGASCCGTLGHICNNRPAYKYQYHTQSLFEHQTYYDSQAKASISN